MQHVQIFVVVMVLVLVAMSVNAIVGGMLVQRIVRKVCVCTFSLSCLLQLLFCIFLGECPTGVAWADKAYGNDVAHQSVECSNAGVCDYTSGKCKCFAGFSGSACQRSKLNML